MSKPSETMQARLEAIAASVGLTWEHVQDMTFRRFAEMCDRERARREAIGEEQTLHGIGERP